MKQVLLFWGCMLLLSFSSSAQNYLSEDFSTGNVTTPPMGWTQNIITGDTADLWHFNNPGGRTFNAPITDPAAIFDSDDYSNNSLAEDVALESPAFDATGATLVLLDFDHFFDDVFGGTLNVDVFDGTAWINAWSTSTTTASNPTLETLDISAQAAGVSNAQVRFRWTGDYAFYWVIDNISVYQPFATDLAVTDVLSPADFGCFGANETVTVELTSVGTDTLDLMVDTALVTMTLSGSNSGVYGSLVSTGMLGSNQSTVVDFTGVDLSNAGITDLNISVSVSGDGDSSNDTLMYSLLTQPIITSYPYSEDFESGAGGWASGGANSSWAFGTPAKTVIMGAASGLNAWVTGGLGTGEYNDDENSAVFSPCFDMTTAPVGASVVMSIWLESEFSYDGAVLQTSVDSGATWQNVGAFESSTNWYNDTTINGDPGGQQVGWTGLNASVSNGWIEVSHPLDPSLIGAPDVRFRVAFGSDGSVQEDGFAFDDFAILVLPPVDMAVTDVLSPDFGCFGTTETVIAELTSFGIDTIDLQIDTAFVSMTLSGANMGVYTSFVSGGTLGAGETTTVDFTGVDLTNVGLTELTISVSVSGEGDSSNDTLMYTLETQPTITSYPYFEDFESGRGGWAASGDNSTWAFGTPAKSVIMGAGSGLNAWVTGGLGTGVYNNNENSSVFSPCFDMSSAPAGAWVAMKIWYESENGFDGAVLQTSVDSGATWQNVGAFGDPINWFNDDDINGDPGGQLEGWEGRGGDGSGGWLQASHALDPSLIGAPDVRFRVAFGSDGSVQYDGFAFDDFAIGVPPTVSFSLADSSSLCIGTTIDAGISGLSYDWSTGDSTQEISVMNNTGMALLDTTIAIMVTDSLGLSGTDSVLVNIYGDPPPSLTGEIISDVLCNGDSTGGIDLTIVADAAPLTFTWDNGATTEDLNGVPAGDYNVVIADSNGCTVDNVTPLMVNEPDSIGITEAMVTDVRCPDDSTGSIMITVAGGVGGYTYSWSNGDTTEDLTDLPVGSYVGTIMDSNMCVLVSGAVPITSTDSLPTASIGLTAAGGGSFDFMGSSVGGTTYVWDFGDGSDPDSTQNPSHTYTVNDTVVVTLSVTNSCGTTMTTETVFVTAVGIADDLLSQNVRVYPNPNQGFFEIRFAEQALEDVKIVLTSTDGKRVYAKALGNVAGGLVHQVTLPEPTARGVYILQLTTSDAVLHKRLIVE